MHRYASQWFFRRSRGAISVVQSQQQSRTSTSPMAFAGLALGSLPAAASVFCDQSSSNAAHEAMRYERCLEYHRSLLAEYRRKWDYDNVESRIPTTTGWPKHVPNDGEISTLEFDYRFAPTGSKYRDDLQFRLAAYYLEVDKKKGFDLLKQLAERGHLDAMALFGIVLNEGRVLEADPQRATVWWSRAAEQNHMQACYELAVALYTGEGVVENEELAVEFFEKAAVMGHAGAAYMLGDCLLDGIGVDRDRAEALEWLVAAGELGHRGARSRVMAVIDQTEGTDYGEFTDASRQSFKSKAAVEELQPEEEVKWTQEDAAKLPTIERRFTIGGGSGNPAVLKKRRTLVAESRTG